VPIVDVAPGETVLLEGHPSWLSIVGFYVLGFLVSAAVGGAVGAIASDVALGIAAGAAVLLVVLVVGFVRRISTTYGITDERLTIKRGLLSRDTQEARLTRVQNVTTRQSFFQRLLGIGTVDFDTAAGSDYDFSFTGISDPARVVRIVDDAQEASARQAPGG
jgi:uncharacterized membrane protein YdbT with pleckstrin-like domain